MRTSFKNEAEKENQTGGKLSGENEVDEENRRAGQD